VWLTNSTKRKQEQQPERNLQRKEVGSMICSDPDEKATKFQWERKNRRKKKPVEEHPEGKQWCRRREVQCKPLGRHQNRVLRAEQCAPTEWRQREASSWWFFQVCAQNTKSYQWKVIATIYIASYDCEKVSGFLQNQREREREKKRLFAYF